MGLLKKLFGKSKSINNNQPQKEKSKEVTKEPSLSYDSNTPDLFKIELYDSLNRYYSSPELNIELNLVDKKGNKLKEHEGLDHTYSEWKKIRSIWDRRSLLFEQFDQTEFNNLKSWQVIERFVKDRYGLKAIEFLKTNIDKNDFDDVRLVVALSKLYRVLNSLNSSMKYAKGAYELRPDLDITKVEYANILHLTGTEEEKEEAHKLMNEVLKKRIENENSDEIVLLNYFRFSKDYIDSSVFAISFLLQGNCDIETWDKIAEDYYWCPLFRHEHAVLLGNQGESLKAIAKLCSLSDEFPWYKPAVSSSIDAINQFRTQANDSTIMKNEMERMLKYQSM
ncbi:hypothetical protein [Tenacibaculum singaporense]|uniref:hypothetical protein n=1 Tax=Tenacibaculum singaporense TaxID=2358479 RepID=UPI000F68F484|nr:hypothetical protein [Tenacibaculum singaporense]RSC93956.1 hypothetical protein EI424_08095 [Tenacibaculum singaporense]